jgi:hypothetical protein
MSENITVIVQEEGLVSVSTNLNNPLDSLSLVGDIDITTNGKENGSVLVYNSTTSKWTSTTTLSAQNMEGGEF